jgi:hypothetical protein
VRDVAKGRSWWWRGRRASSTDRRALLGGAAALAAPVVNVVDGGVLAGAATPTDLAAVAHGLYWLTANLAEAGPLMLAVDDLHWSRSAVASLPRIRGTAIGGPGCVSRERLPRDRPLHL